MRIDCDSCGAAYAIDDALISDRGIRAQCPKCGTQKVVKKDAAADPFSAPAPEPAGSPFGGAPSTPDPFAGPSGPPADAGGGNPFGAPADPFAGAAGGAPPANDPFAGGGGAPEDPFGGGAPQTGNNPFAAAPAPADPFSAPPAGNPFGPPSGPPEAGDPFGGPPAGNDAPAAGSNPFAPAGDDAAPDLFGAPNATPDDPFGGSNPFAGVKDVPADNPADPFGDAAGEISNDDPFGGAQQDRSDDDGPAVPWQVKTGRKAEVVTLAEIRERIRSGTLTGTDQAAPEGQPLQRISEISILSVSLPKVARAKRATGASASGSNIGRILGLLIAVAVVGGGVYGVYTFFPTLFEGATDEGVNPFRKSLSEWSVQFPEVVGTSQEHVVDGRKFMKADTAQSYRQADEEFRKALILDVGNLDAIAGYVENFANLPNARADDKGMQLAFDGIEWGRKRAPENVSLMRAQGALYLAKNEVEQASRSLRAALRVEPGNVSTMLLLAQTELARAPQESLRYVSKVRTRAPELKLALLVEGAALRRLGDFETAIARLEERLTADPGNTATLKEFARLELDLGNGKAAVKRLSKLLDVEERDIEARLMRAKVLYQVLGLNKDAEAEFRFILDNYAKPAGDLLLPALSHTAYLSYIRKDLDDAQALIEKARNLDRNYAPAAYVSGLIRNAQGDEISGRSEVEDAVRLLSASGPGSENENVARSTLADFQVAADQREAAYRNYALVTEYFPRYSRGFFGFAAAYMSDARPGQAATYMRKALDIDPHHNQERDQITDFPTPPSVLAGYAKTYARAKVSEEGRPLRAAGEGMIRFVAGQTGAAKRLFTRTKAEDRLNHAGLLYLGVMALDAGNLKEAKKLLSTALRTTGKNHSVTRLYAARVDIRLGKTSEAMKTINEIIENDPTYAAALFTRAKLNYKNGETDAAKEELQLLVREYADFLPAKKMLARLGK